jgi:nitronate monooxygenase
MNTPRSFAVRGRTLLPIVQGGMGVGVSAHRLAGAVARAGGVGTIASVDLRHHHADLSEQSKHCRDKDELNRLNLVALDREIKAALDIAAGRGMLAVNVMKAVDAHPAYVRQACASGAQAIVMGAGLPLDLPELTAGYPEVALIPILSDARGVAIVLKKWARLKKDGSGGRLPDAIVIEHPLYAGGHLGAPNPADLANARFDIAEVLPGIFKLSTTWALRANRSPSSSAAASTATKSCWTRWRWALPPCSSVRRSPSPRRAMPTPTSSVCWPRPSPRTSPLS